MKRPFIACHKIKFDLIFKMTMIKEKFGTFEGQHKLSALGLEDFYRKGHYCGLNGPHIRFYPRSNRFASIPVLSPMSYLRF